MTSAIDATKPVDGVPAVKEDLRNNLAATKSEIEDLQAADATLEGKMAILDNPRSLVSAFPDTALSAVNQEATPYHFVPDVSYIGRGAKRKLSADYATVADAQAAFPEIAPELAGADLSTVTFDWAAFQSMSRSVQKNGNGVPQQSVPAGIYDFSDTWKVLEGVNFQSATVLGAGRGKGSFIPCTTLRALFGDRPLVSIQGGRHVEFGRFSLEGLNTAGSYAPGKLAAKDPSLWSVGSPTISEGRYNPCVGLALDPYTTDPGGGQGYPNDPYGRRTTSQANFHNLHLQWFYVGFGAGLSNDASLGDGITLYKVDCNGTTYGCVSGGSQNRILSYNEGYMEGGFRCFDNTTFGTAAGNCFQVQNLVMVLYYELFNYRQADPCEFTNVHCEQFVRLGRWSGGTQQFPFQMNGGHLKFWGALDNTIHRPSSLMLNEGGRATFRSTRFDTVPSASTFFPGHFNFQCRNNAEFHFKDMCTFFQSAPQPNRCQIGFNRFNSNPPTHEGTFFNSGLAADLSSIQIRQSGLDDTINLTPVTSEGLSAKPRIGAGPRTHTINIRGEGTYRYQASQVFPSFYVPGFSNPVITNTTTPFNAIDFPHDQLQFDTTEPEMFQVNDDIAARLVEDSPAEGIIGYVTDITGNTVTVLMTCDASEVVQPANSVSLVVPSEWAPKDNLQGTALTSSNVITFASDVSDVVFPGDFIQSDTGTWTRVRIVSVAGDGLSVTLNKNAPVTGLVDLFWGRLFALTGTAV